MGIRTTEKDLKRAADELSQLTGEQFFVNYPNGHPTLFKKEKKGSTNCFSGDSHKDLYEKIGHFHAGIEYGLKLVANRDNPDLANPKKALQRISAELEKIAYDFASPLDYDDQYKFPEGFEKDEHYGTAIVRDDVRYTFDGANADENYAQHIVDISRRQERKALVLKIPAGGIPDAGRKLRTGYGIFICWE